MVQDEKLAELIVQVEAVSPKLVDCWQATAIVESLGYTDRIIQAEFNFANALEIGEYIYQQNNLSPATPEIKPRSNLQPSTLAEIYAFVEQFSRSFVYAIPLISLLALSTVEKSDNWKFIPPQLAVLFTIATLASLITSGGFVQAIARRGEFYLGLGLSQQAKRACISLFGWGMLTSFLLAVLGTWFGFYRSLFPDNYIVLGAIFYIVLSSLWMLLSMLSLLSIWGTPSALVGLTTLYWVLRFSAGMAALEAQMVAILAILIMLSIVIWILFNRRKKDDVDGTNIKLPNLSATVYLLAPFFAYGITYFCFIFTDRLVAGWAVNTASGLIFAIDSAYQKGMDLALLNFLLAVPLSEYLAYKLINYWYQKAKAISYEDMTKLSKELKCRYYLLFSIAIIFFVLLVSFTVGFPIPKPWAVDNNVLSWVGSVGYLLLVLGLFNAVMLFSLNLATKAIASMFPGLVVNFVVGYIAANAIAPDWAVLGLISGSIVFLVISHRKVMQAISNPDYAYYLGGY